jgi:hypothetical protein
MSEPPGNDFPPSLVARLANETKTPYAPAMPHISCSQRATLAGPGIPSPLGHVPRAGAAEHTKMISTSSSASSMLVI